ncbi:hypothetical protein [Gaetbulibacter saemankumensis]|uniref:hypothetical protein n=1 Tax=Gaetbulibacter saemankumensis TaxID=311208 RepID=UPI0003FBBECF|nr:hypothetical protein [Gaetbulibacter saemankumensis]
MRKLLFLLFVLPLVLISQENESYLLNITEITVKMGHNDQFTEGVKAWKNCYIENEGEDHWNFWHRFQGVGNVYTLTSRMANWAEIDKKDEAGKKCRIKVVNLIMPHVESINYNIARSMPDISRSGGFPEDTEIVWVYNVQTSNSTHFKEVASEIGKSVKKAEGDSRGIWYSTMGGAPEVADYFIGVPIKNFAAMDVERDGVWEIYEKEHGKSKADALRSKFRSAVSSDWSYIYTLNKELSH